MREEIGKVLSKGKAAGVLRLVFHDAGTFDIYDKTGASLSNACFLAPLSFVLPLITSFSQL